MKTTECSGLSPDDMMQRAIVGCLLGTAVGDALGLACEGLSRRRQRKLFPDVSGYHFLFGWGMVSDDTEHCCMVAQALMESEGDVDVFPRRLSRHLRWWLLGLPAGIGKATLRAIVKLWFGVPASRSGVYSAGNGPAMRSAIIGVCYGDNLPRMRVLVRASTRLTHTDPKAEYGAFAVALAAYMAKGSDFVAPPLFLRTLRDALGEEAAELLELVARAVASAEMGETTEAFADSLGLERGVSGYVYHTVPVVLQAWLRHQDSLETGLTSVIRCGGDTDTIGAILGAIVGSRVGARGIPAVWRERLCEWPRTVRYMERLGATLAASVNEGRAQPAPRLFPLAVLARNIVFLIVVLLHGFRRLLPPY